MTDMKAIRELLRLIRKIPQYDRGFSWERRDWQGNEAIHAYNENAAVLKFIIDNTDNVASGLSSLLDNLESARREALEEAAKLIEDGYPRPGISYRLDTCLHDKFQWEECEGCAAWAIRKLAAQSIPPPQPLEARADDRTLPVGAGSTNLTPQMIRDTAGWCQSESELRDTLRAAATALEAAQSSEQTTFEISARLLKERDEARLALATSTPPQPCRIPDPSSRDCPNMKEVGGGMEGERYRCAVCGKGYFLDYEEIK